MGLRAASRARRPEATVNAMSGPPASSPASDRPLLVYDGECGFCRRWIERARRRTADRVDYRPFQVAAAPVPGPAPGSEGGPPADPRVQFPIDADFRRSVYLFEPRAAGAPGAGRVTRAAEAAFRTLSH